MLLALNVISGVNYSVSRQEVVFCLILLMTLSYFDPLSQVFFNLALLLSEDP